MKPHRVRMCHTLVTNYGLYKKMDVIVRQQPGSSSRFVSFAGSLAGGSLHKYQTNSLLLFATIFLIIVSARNELLRAR